ncbi:MAG: PAS domain S-box protein [Anaerolineae bacterium]|jgi:PAS domain S-box-containing protein
MIREPKPPEITAADRSGLGDDRFRALFEGIPACCWTFARDGTILDWNRACETLYGWSAEEAVGHRMYDLMVQEKNVAATREIIASIFEGQRFEGLEFEDVCADGTKCRVLTNEYPLHDARGDVAMGVCAQVDITARVLMDEARDRARDELEAQVEERTEELSQLNAKLAQEVAERRRAEQVMEERWLFLRALLDAAPDAIVTLDADQRITEWNAAAQRLFGYAREQAMGRNLDRLITKGDTYAEAVGFTEATLAQEAVVRTETVRYRKDGSPVDVLLSAAPIAVDDALIGGVAVYGDISRLKRAEEQLARYAADLEQANEEIKQFAYIVSHDLRAPLINLKGFSSELRFALDEIQSTMDAALPHLDGEQQQRLRYALDEDVPEALSFIESSVSRMDAFINAVLRLSRLGRRELEPEPVDVEALARKTLDSLAHQLEEHEAEVTIGPLPQVVADRTAMEQILGNLLDNAVKYLPPDRPGEIEVTGERGDHVTTFCVRDNGRGIAGEDMEKVFAPFRRAGWQDQPGEGMGLPYVQTLVRRHGGRVWCESELGVGTAFTFTIARHLEGGNNLD